MRSIGIMGGTFNPIHNGHLLMAEIAGDAARLDEIVFIPTGISPHKPTLLDGAHRYNMALLAVRGRCGYSVSDIELKRTGKSFTYMTLSEMHDENPDTRISSIMGADMMRSFMRWRRADIIAKLAALVVIPRPGEEMESVRAVADEARAAFNADIRFAAEAGPDISSTMIRRMVRAGEDISGLVPASVADYIYKNHLYLEEDDAIDARGNDSHTARRIEAEALYAYDGCDGDGAGIG